MRRRGIRSTLFRGLEGGFFELAELPFSGAPSAAGSLGGVDGSGTDALEPRIPAAGSSGENGSRPGRSSGGDVGVDVAADSGGRIARAPNPSGSGGSSLPALASCLLAIRDQANRSTCIQASSTPTLGKLYPISANLFVAVGGNVGIGTTAPTAKLDVDGDIDLAGSLSKNGALFMHTLGGPGNTALGSEAAESTTTGSGNTAVGMRALWVNTTGSDNTASGRNALRNNTTGSFNTARGIWLGYTLGDISLSSNGTMDLGRCAPGRASHSARSAWMVTSGNH